MRQQKNIVAINILRESIVHTIVLNIHNSQYNIVYIA